MATSWSQWLRNCFHESRRNSANPLKLHTHLFQQMWQCSCKSTKLILPNSGKIANYILYLIQTLQGTGTQSNNPHSLRKISWLVSPSQDLHFPALQIAASRGRNGFFISVIDSLQTHVHSAQVALRKHRKT